jgi:hypothetical protein
MALQQGDIENFETLKRAAKSGDLALVESKDGIGVPAGERTSGAELPPPHRTRREEGGRDQRLEFRCTDLCRGCYSAGLTSGDEGPHSASRV